jgi:deoxycytidylate deaminase|tara:strand:- start:2953 stop:3390 length:438 start_codon:yes stop_codon:yes gene_type:complete
MKDAMGMQVAFTLAEKGTCARRKIGCNITDAAGHILGEGWNGPPGWSCFDRPCPDAAVEAGQGAYQEVRCYGVHAEVRALLDAAPSHDKIHSIYCTKAPCGRCAEMLIHATPSHARLVFAVWPNDRSGLEAWSDAGRAYFCLGDG